jgi:hypothetical protein
MGNFKLSPSELTFLWDECPRCFYLKVVMGIPRPSMPFPGIFSNIDSLMKRMYEGGRTESLLPQLPPGEFYLMGKWVESSSIAKGNIQAYVKGIFDTVIRFDDGSYAVVDFKTSQPSTHHVEFYGRQLAAYAYALEHPAATGKLALSPVTKLGLICVEPIDVNRDETGRIRYVGDATWMEVPKDEAKFLGFIDEVMKVLSLPEPPPPAEKCAFCKYRADAREHGL